MSLLLVPFYSVSTQVILQEMSLLWSFELIPAPAAQYVRPSVILSARQSFTTSGTGDEYNCNCSTSTSSA